MAVRLPFLAAFRHQCPTIASLVALAFLTVRAVKDLQIKAFYNKFENVSNFSQMLAEHF